MAETDNKQQQPNKEPRCDQKQLDFLKSCSKKGKEGIEEWNKWRRENPDKEIWLQKAALPFAKLQGASLREANLQGANLKFAKLQEAEFCGANLQGADLSFAKLQEVYLLKAKLQGAYLMKANLQGAKFREANLQGAKLYGANLQGAELSFAKLQRAEFLRANLQGAELLRAELQRADFTASSVGGLTLFWDCKIDRKTDFRGVALESCRIDEGAKYLLEYNRRRMNSQQWYRGKSEKKWRRAMRLVVTWPVRWFLEASDYGRSAFRIIGVFFFSAFLFAAIYANFPGFVSGLNVKPHEPLWHYGWLLIIRPIYFSIVTMTTLGFGDMYAEKGSIAGHILLIAQVLLGYVLLGALVTRFGVLFKSGLVQCEFAKGDEKPDSASSAE